MQREIGSNFWLNPQVMYGNGLHIELDKYGLCGSDAALFSTGRGAESFVLKTIERRNKNLKKTALIPPFTCETVIKPFLKFGYSIYTYPVDKNLNTEPGQLKLAIEQTKAQVVFLHRYFGFDTLINCEDVIRFFNGKGVVFIEDKTQSVYSSFIDLSADYTVGSLRKWTGLPDGGYAVCRQGEFDDKPLEYDKSLETAKLKACFSKYAYMEGKAENKEEFLEQYRKAEEILDAQQKYYTMSPAAEHVQATMAIGEMKEKRRQNYNIVFGELKSVEEVRVLTPELSDNDVPLYFAMLVGDRERLQEQLRKNNIYAPVVWPKAEIVPAICQEAEYIYQHILCLPIDQRYGKDDMQRMVECVKEEVL